METIRKIKGNGDGFGYRLTLDLLTCNPNLVSSMEAWSIEYNIAMSPVTDIELGPIQAVKEFIHSDLNQT